MKRTWLVWTLVGGVLITVLIAFNYERGKEAVSLSEIFPEKGAFNNEVEYEFFDTDEKGSSLVTTGEMKQSIHLVQTAPAAVAKTSATPAPEKQMSASSVPVAKLKTTATAAVKQVPVSSGSAAKTRTVAVAPASSGNAAVAAVGNGKIYTIQVAAFKERSRADKAVAQAQQKGYTAYVDERSRSDGSVWYQICIGKFNAQSSAKELLIKIKQDYKDGFIRTLSGK